MGLVEQVAAFTAFGEAGERVPRHWLGGVSSQGCWWASVSVLFIRRVVPRDFLVRAVRFWLRLRQRKQRGKEIPRDCSSVTSVLQPLSVMGVETRGEMQLTKPRFPLFKLRRKVVKENSLTLPDP